MKFIANRPLRGDYGSVVPGEVFDVPELLVKKFQVLEGKGIVRRYREPRQAAPFAVTYQNKAVVPSQVKNRA